MSFPRECARTRAQNNPSEHRFKTQDEQIRVLDRERQKLASIVDQTERRHGAFFVQSANALLLVDSASWGIVIS